MRDQELMAEREVLEGDGRRPEEQGAEKRPDTDHDQHGVTSASGMASEPKLYRDQRWRRKGKFSRDK